MLPRRFLYFLLFLLQPVILSAQIPDIRFEKYTVQNGLSQNSTTALFQDSRGFLWIGASWGLNRYDGRVIKKYNRLGENNLADLSITSFAEDKEGNIWIGTSNGLSYLDPFTEKFTTYIEGVTPKDIPDGVCNVYVDKENNLWVGGRYGLSLYNRATKTFKTFSINTAGEDIRINRYINDYLEDSKGRFWISTSYGIKLFNRSEKKYQTYAFKETDGKRLVENSVQGLYEDKFGNIWAGTWNGGILKYDAEKNTFANYKILSAPYDPAQTVHDINSITLNNHYYLLLASEAGLLLADPEKIIDGKAPAEKILIESDAADPSLPREKWRILKDRQDNYWISGNSSLLKIDPANQSFQWRSLPDERFKTVEVFHVIPDNKVPGQKVFLTTQQGWWQYDLVSHNIRKHNLPKGFEELLGNINRFVATPNGYWFTSQLGIGFYDPYADKVRDLTHLIRSKKDYELRTGPLCMDNLGRIWFSIYRTGIRIYDPQTNKLTLLFTDTTLKDNLIGKNIFDMKKLPDGSILFSAAHKIFHIDPQTLSYSTIEAPGIAGPATQERAGPRKILLDRNNRVLVTSWQGVYLFQNEKLTPLYPGKRAADFMIYNILQDNNGDFWLTTNLGLYKTDSVFKKGVLMNTRIPADPDNISEVFYSPEDKFIITSVGKIGTFSLPELGINKTPPAIVINRLRTGNKEDYLVSLKKQQWDISFKDAIEIEISAINFSNEKGNKIYYQLAGRDNDWKELTGNPVIRYEQLPPDHYVFKVKAVNEDGVSSKETILSFRVLPPFWRTWWFIGIVIIALAISLYAIYRYRLTKALELEKMRTRISTDLHDDIGATLSSISIYSETIKQQTAVQLPQLTPMLDKMGETSREMVGNMSDIVWAINPENDSFEKMLGRMQNLAAELCTVKNIQLHFTADEKLNQIQLSMEQRRNIYLIFKESLNNALKYADCRNMRIELLRETHSLVLSVKDNGKGFNERTVLENKRGGNGLKNMRDRAAEINGELIIHTEENKGTHILLKTSIT